MKTGILITARLGSTRLKKKHLLKVSEKPILAYLLQRINQVFAREIEQKTVQVVIATSDEPENREFEIFRDQGATVFYGSQHNIPLRHLQAAQALGLDGIVAVDGDDIFCSVHGMRLLFEALNQGKDYVKTSSLPFGMNSAGYSTGYLESCLVGHPGDMLETGWGRIFDQSAVTDVNMGFPLQDNRLRFTLDYAEDFEFFQAAIEGIGQSIDAATDSEIVDYVISQEVYKLNETINQEYWENFYKHVAKERSQNESE